MATKIGVAIVGASGYAARELIGILLGHPRAQITAATSRQGDLPRLDALHPSLARRIDLVCEPFDADRIAERASFAFLALPHTASMAVVPSLRQRGVRVIDLSATIGCAIPKFMRTGTATCTPTPKGCVLRSTVCPSSSVIELLPSI